MRLAMEGLVSVAAAVVVGAILSGPALGQTYVYPSKGQSPQQQQKDQGECHGWATQQSGVNPAAMAPPPAGPTGQVARGAARGAAVGAVGGAIGGDAGKGAAIGAGVGAVFGGMRRMRYMEEQQQMQQQQQQQQQMYMAQQQNSMAQGRANYERAFGACMAGRGYTVR